MQNYFTYKSGCARLYCLLLQVLYYYAALTGQTFVVFACLEGVSKGKQCGLKAQQAHSPGHHPGKMQSVSSTP